MVEIPYNKIVVFRGKAGLNWSYSHNLMGGKSTLRKYNNQVLKIFCLKNSCLHNVCILLISCSVKNGIGKVF